MSMVLLIPSCKGGQSVNPGSYTKCMYYPNHYYDSTQGNVLSWKIELLCLDALRPRIKTHGSKQGSCADAILQRGSSVKA